MSTKTELEKIADKHTLTTIITLMRDSIVSANYNHNTGESSIKKYKTEKILDEIDTYFLNSDDFKKENSPLYRKLNELAKNNKNHEISIIDIENIYEKDEPDSTIFEQANQHIDTIATSTPEGIRAFDIYQSLLNRASLQETKKVKPEEFSNLITTDEAIFINNLAKSGLVGLKIIEQSFLIHQKSLYNEHGIDMFNPRIYETKSVPQGMETAADILKIPLQQKSINKDDVVLSEGRKLLNDAKDYQHLFIERERQKHLEKARKIEAAQKIERALDREEIPFIKHLTYALTTPSRLINRYGIYRDYRNGEINKDTYMKKINLPEAEYVMHEFDLKRDKIQNYQDELKTLSVAHAINDLKTAKGLCGEIETKIANGEDYSEDKAEFKEKIESFKHYFDQQVTMLNGGTDKDGNPINPLPENDTDYLTAQNSIRIMLEEADQAQEVFEKSSDEEIKEEGKGLKKWLGESLESLGEVLSNGIKKIRKMIGLDKEEDQPAPESP